jgi:hypothetical protein
LDFSQTPSNQTLRHDPDHDEFEMASLTSRAISPFSTGFPCKGPPVPLTAFITSPRLVGFRSERSFSIDSRMACWISSLPIILTCDAYSSRTAIWASSFSFRSFRLAAANSAEADLDKAERFLRSARTCRSVLSGDADFDAFVVSAMRARRTLRLRRASPLADDPVFNLRGVKLERNPLTGSCPLSSWQSSSHL